MTKLIGTLAVSAAMVLVPALARAQYDADDPEGGWEAQWEGGTATQAEPPEYQVPPAPPAETPPAPEAQAQPAAPAPPGQWVYTQQYGWIWMPYSDAYTRVPANGYGEPYAYVYYPAYGWEWLAAPWVWGIGPWPVFGVFGPARFAWYGHGWWRSPQRWHYALARGGYAGSGFRPAPYRPAPTYRAGAGWGRPAPFGGGGSAFVGHGRGGGFFPSHGAIGRGSGGVRSGAPGGGRGFAAHGGFGGGGRSAGGHGGHGGHGGRGGRGHR